MKFIPSLQRSAGIALACAAFAASAVVFAGDLSSSTPAVTGKPVSITGFAFEPQVQVALTITEPFGNRYSVTAYPDANGALYYSLAPRVGGTYTVQAFDSGGRMIATTQFNVLPEK